MMKKSLLFTSLLLGVAFDILFWQKAPGISFAVFVSLCLVAGATLLQLDNIRPARLSLVLMAALLFFTAMTFIRQEPLTTLLNYALALLLMVVLALTYRSGLWLALNFTSLATNFFFFAIHLITFGWSEVIQPEKDQDRQPGQGKPGRFWAILRGVMLALPVLLLFGALFKSADMVFASKLDSLLARLSLQQLGQYAFRGAYILGITYLLSGVFNYAASRSQETRQFNRGKPILAPFLGFTEAAIILGSTLLLFAVFVLVQFQYFFSGQANISLEGFTYSEYARRGFGELVAVATLSLILLQGLGTITKRAAGLQKKVFSALSISLVALVIIILISSFQRLYLYEAAYGFTQARTYAHVFILWLGILLLAVAVIEMLDQQRFLAAAALFTLVGFTASLNFLNVDAFIVRQNLAFAGQGKELDTVYLSTLSGDAVPALVREYSATNLNPRTRDQVGAVLACYNLKQKTGSPRRQSWQSFNLPDWKAARHLQGMAESLEKYGVQDEQLPVLILSPDGEEYPCPGLFPDTSPGE